MPWPSESMQHLNLSGDTSEPGGQGLKHLQQSLENFTFLLGKPSVPEFIDPRFRENKPKMLVFSHRKRTFWACCVFNFGH
jgi:hypothetical protein